MSKVISIRISESTQLTLEMKAKSEGKSVGDFVKQAVNDSLDTHKIDKIKAEQREQEQELEKLLKRSDPFKKTYKVSLNESENRDSGTVPKMDIKRYTTCSVFGRFAYSHTAPSGRSGRNKSTRAARNQPFRLRRPLPISTQIYE
ncbi:hypothetical protein VCRA2122O12_610001 [Vibrio crassostreae]|nr:hypothetical protein VCRA2119O383_390004 [Vibrio crassostreae]CAK3495595.1 hypothetical protein VCRA2128O94_650004 [Vibrio crassostreae]CAK3556022.1 hypothetical protein VCRA2122O12_610001 [Vibrio crassostreae]